jgi:hypothetical protein
MSWQLTGAALLFCSQSDILQANVRVFVISGESDFLTVLSILLNSECNSQFFWRLAKAIKIMQRHEMSFSIVKIPIDSNAGPNDLVA